MKSKIIDRVVRAHFLKNLSTKLRLYIVLAVIVMISLVGGAIAIYSTASGPWGYSDSVAYISTARSVLQGKGLGYYEGNTDFEYMSHLPAFYSLVLSAIGITGINLVVAVRWFDVVAFVISIFAAGWIFYRYSRAKVLGIIASALMCAFPGMVSMFSSAFSEPLFILLLLLSGFFLLAYLRTENLLRLFFAAVIVGFMPVTRYVGLALPLCGALTVLLFASGPWQRRLKSAAVFTLVAYLPTLCWFIWSYFASGHSIGELSLGINLETLVARFKTFNGLFIVIIHKWWPIYTNFRYRTRIFILAAMAIAIAMLSLLAYRRMRKAGEGDSKADLAVFAFFGLAAFAHLAVLMISYLFTSPTPDVNDRTLLPLYVGSVMSLLGALALWQAAWFRGRRRWLQVVPWLMAALCLYWYLPQARQTAAGYHLGDGLTAYHWNSSQTIQGVRTLPQGMPVISNDWELLMLWTDRPVRGLWNTFPVTSPVQIVRYGTKTTDVAQSIFCKQGAALVIFEDFPAQYREKVGEAYLPQLPALFEGLTVRGKYSDGTIYLCP